jgi:hypothetical protein
MKRTKQDYLRLLNETVSYYTTEKNELSYLNEECAYLGEGGSMCAVGRCLINPKGKDLKLDEVSENDTSVEVLFKVYQENKILKKEYRGFSIGFWKDLQSFHDTSLYISNFELTSYGIGAFEDIKRNHCI